MNGRVRIAAGAAVVLAVGLAALLVAGGAGGDDARASLSWKGKPLLMQNARPTDRIFAVRLRNDSLEDVDLVADEIRVLDADGRAVQSTARFLEAFAHGLYPWSQRPEDLGDFERRRLGEIATIKPGADVPLTLSWRVPAGRSHPTTVRFGDATSLQLPKPE